jgi:hypothetical protein
MKSIRKIAERHRSLTIRFSHIYDHGIVTRIFTNRKMIVSDSIKGVGELKTLIEKAIEKLEQKLFSNQKTENKSRQPK